jgi:ribulose 1,5-bisphosphate synthetase/thiazole synthase
MPASRQLLEKFGAREVMGYDIIIVGGGPSGLSAVIRRKQMATEGGRDIFVSLTISCFPSTIPR